MLLNKSGFPVFGKEENQKGITIVEISVGLAIIAFLAIFLAPRAGALFSKTRIELGQQELMTLVAASQQYRQVIGSYAAISFDTLDKNGYHIEPFSKVKTLNAFGKVITLTPASSNAAATIGYTTDADVDCKQLESRLSDLKPAVAVCANNVLTVTLN